MIKDERAETKGGGPAHGPRKSKTTKLAAAELEIRRLNEERERMISERTARLEATNRELEAFAFSVSHDLKAPLRAIDGFSSILLEDYGPVLDAEGKRLLGIVRSNAIKMGELIAEILDLSRVGRVELRPSRIDMGAMALAVYHEQAKPEELACFTLIVDPVPAVEGDPTLLRLVWENLISNALKFSRSSEKKHIEISSETASGAAIYRVRDFGIGFDPEYSAKLFTPFQRLHRLEDFEGNGVGLAIVKRIVERHAGAVGAEKRKDGGSLFWFSLPLSRKPGEATDAGI